MVRPSKTYPAPRSLCVSLSARSACIASTLLAARLALLCCISRRSGESRNLSGLGCRVRLPRFSGVGRAAGGTGACADTGGDLDFGAGAGVFAATGGDLAFDAGVFAPNIEVAGAGVGHCIGCCGRIGLSSIGCTGGTATGEGSFAGGGVGALGALGVVLIGVAVGDSITAR
jgi:hypothetical protein